MILATLALSDDSRITAGILLITITTVESGGFSLMRVARGKEPATEFQKSFARAGHGHAGVFVILALLAQILTDATHLHGIAEILARYGIVAAAILVPAGFFASSGGPGVTQPNRAILLVYAGVLTLTVGVVTLGIGLLSA